MERLNFWETGKQLAIEETTKCQRRGARQHINRQDNDRTEAYAEGSHVHWYHARYFFHHCVQIIGRVKKVINIINIRIIGQ